ncbi:hypothetical protein HanXRQr2_Chr10g0447311 [Helianthus annuus]|uniref:Uncharacterized protein n=1 Tax=Helianthus annuus TaxID=4232 RepID=A0A9K3N578_HELAN|nr:hypothetical protein HanXRQr2_Chr10g0447311 [Helianthus annuus]
MLGGIPPTNLLLARGLDKIIVVNEEQIEVETENLWRNCAGERVEPEVKEE